jgi:hypothetical protein
MVSLILSAGSVPVTGTTNGEARFGQSDEIFPRRQASAWIASSWSGFNESWTATASTFVRTCSGVVAPNSKVARLG